MSNFNCASDRFLKRQVGGLVFPSLSEFSTVYVIHTVKGFGIVNKCKKEKWLSEEVLQIAVKRREAKSKGEKERYRHLNAEFQRIARRDKKAFLSDQCQK